jgi:hypothetical protein
LNVPMETQSNAIELGDTALTKVAADLGMRWGMRLPLQTSRPDYGSTVRVAVWVPPFSVAEMFDVVLAATA